MGGRRRNLLIIALVLGLLAASAIVIATKPTVLGLDLRGGIQVGLPNVQNAQQAIDQIGTTAQLYFYDLEANIVPPPKKGLPADPAAQADPNPEATYTLPNLYEA